MRVKASWLLPLRWGETTTRGHGLRVKGEMLRRHEGKLLHTDGHPGVELAASTSGACELDSNI